MAHLRSRRTRAIALPAGLALTASLGFLPAGAATAAPTDDTPAAVSTDGPALSYVVNVDGGRSAVAKVKRAVEKAGGTVVIAYDSIGVIVAHSQNPDFAGQMRAVKNVASAGATRTNPLVPQRDDAIDAEQPLTAEQMKAAAAKATDEQDPLEPLQWDLPAIKADKAHQRSLGSSKVTVAVLDSGIDDTHPDIAQNFDRRASANCVSGVPVTENDAWRPAAGESDHGMHVAGTIAAAKNGFGVTGVAPGVKVSSLKVANPDGFFYTEAVLCGFMWAADHGADVTNNSYYVDPWLYNCKADDDQKALVETLTRATRYAERKGVVHVASAGNSRTDLTSEEVTDTTSPNDTTPVTRVVNPRECPDIPAMLPGVVTVSATGAKGLKSSYSNYGHGVVDIAAPGGDSTALQPPEAPATSGLILSTTFRGGHTWNYKAGTSMAAPHVAGVVALIKSKHPYLPAAGVKALLYAQADDRACTNPYDINGDGTVDAVCEGGKGKNGFYGAGMVDALDAVRW
ncbi:peptidase S8 [Streptomyces sp. ICN441]|uniref:S8 family peptidase n=1 Tax=Streptomyces TaxID=1883 RepID=UPI0010690927|nr:MULTISPECIES: S8 family serine peptidase [Streptomyces]MCY0983443.1 S8 family serine peptidase [Streptomyces tirandamycinicus]TFE54402.1 peptidase S8 [Streptomyces sp. ICN441]